MIIGNSQTSNNINDAYNALSASVGKLSSGLRINSASDDAAGLAVRELLRADIATAKQSSRNISDGVSMLQTAEGASSVISGNLTRMKQLVAQASTGTYSDSQKQLMQNEFDELSAENDRIVSDTEFNGVKLYENTTVDIATGDGEAISVNMQQLSSTSADLVNDAAGAMAAVDAAIIEVSGYRGDLGASMNRLESAAEVVDIESENILAAESRISDVDMAMEVASMTSNQVQTEVAIGAQVHLSAVSQAIMMLIG